MKRKIIKRSAWLLAIAIGVSALVFGQDVAYGAVGIETDKNCSLTFALPENGRIEGTIGSGGDALVLDQVDQKYTDHYQTLEQLLEAGEPLQVKLYRVADVTVSGQYELKPEFSALGQSVSYKILTETDGAGRIILPGDPDYNSDNAGEELTVDGISSVETEHKAIQWEALGRTADTLKGTSATREKALGKDDMTIGGLETGLYLVCVDQVTVAEYHYDFVPFMVSLPNNYYSLPDGSPINDDTWVYDVTVGLKPEQADRFGTLIIEKQLDNFNQLEGVTNRQGTFVFDVRAEKDGQLKYSNVVSLEFDGPGSKTVTIGPDESRAGTPDYFFAKIPAGSVVTVKEIYSGAEYTIVGDAEKTIGVSVGSFFQADGEGTNQLTFENTYDGRLNNGASVVNRYQIGEWNKQE